jgi:hypothetical protein
MLPANVQQKIRPSAFVPQKHSSVPWQLAILAPPTGHPGTHVSGTGVFVGVRVGVLVEV